MTASATPWLFAGFGWHWDDAGVWRVTPRARLVGDFMRGRRGDARRHPAVADNAPTADEGAEGWRLVNLPIVAHCPHCDSPLRLEAAVLGVDPSPHEHRTVNRTPIAPGKSNEESLCCNGGRDRAIGPRGALIRDRMD